FTPVSNWFVSAVAGVIGIDGRRKLPAWKRQTFARWREANQRPVGPASRRVFLFNDTFTNHYDPEIGIAAVEVLERGGYSVDVVRPGCCGRPLISQGLLEGARAHAAKIVDGLFPITSAGSKIL